MRSGSNSRVVVAYPLIKMGERRGVDALRESQTNPPKARERTRLDGPKKHACQPLGIQPRNQERGATAELARYTALAQQADDSL